MMILNRGCAHVAMLTTGVEHLAKVLRHSSASQREVIAAEFDRLSNLVGALPLPTDEYCFANNWLASARECWTTGDLGTAR
jgi:hypothetical protein